MSRLPPISPRDLRDHADPERIERVWERVRAEAPVGAAFKPARTSGRPFLLMAAALGMLGVGIAIGVAVPDRDGPMQRETASSPLADVFATGTKERSFSLPGGGTIALERDSLVEVVELTDGHITLSLLRGGATVDATALPVMVVAGEARVSAAAGSSVAMARREADVDVLVSQGTAEVSSPAGRHLVGRGQALAHVPTVKTVARVEPPSLDPATDNATPTSSTARPTVALVHGSPDAVPPPVSEPIAVSPSWLVLAGNLKYEDAYDALQQGAGLEATIQNAQSAGELYLLADIAGSKKKVELHVRALRRVADEFSSDPRASAAAMELASIYESSDKALAAKYRDIAGRAAAFKEPVLCRELRELSPDAKGEYDAEAVRKATEYLAKFPGSSCDDDAHEILERASKSTVPAPSASAPAVPAPSGSAAPVAPGSATPGSAPKAPSTTPNDKPSAPPPSDPKSPNEGTNG